MRESEAKAYEEGVEAADLGWASEQSSPYPCFSRENLAWQKGFSDRRSQSSEPK